MDDQFVDAPSLLFPTNESSASSLYQLFGDQDLQPLLLSLVILRWLVAMLATCSDAALVYVTVRNKSLHGTCNLFIGSQALFEALTLASFNYSLWLSLTGQNFVPLAQCMPVMAFFSLCNLMRKLALYLVSLDRLLMISLPILFGRKPLLFFCVSMGVACCYGLSVLCWTITGTMEPSVAGNRVTCTVADLTNTGFVGNFVLANAIVVVALAIANYAALWAVLKCKHGISNSEACRHYSSHVQKMLLTITLLASLGWLLNPAVRLALPSLSLTALRRFYVSVTLSCISSITCALNAPVLYYFSKDYREAFQKSLGPLIGMQPPQSALTKVITIQQQQQQQHAPSSSTLAVTERVQSATEMSAMREG